MLKKKSLWVLAIFAMLAAAGCATGSNRNYDSEISSLNSRMASLQAEISTKDQEISKLEGQLADQRAQMNQTEAEKQAMSRKLEDALSELDAAKAKAAARKAASQESDLK